MKCPPLRRHSGTHWPFQCGGLSPPLSPRLKKRTAEPNPHQTYQPAGGLRIPNSVRIECGELRVRDRFISIFMSKAGHARGFRDYPAPNHRFIAAVECTPHLRSRCWAMSKIGRTFASCAPDQRRTCAHAQSRMRVIFRRTKNRIVPRARDFSRGLTAPEHSIAAWIGPLSQDAAGTRCAPCRVGTGRAARSKRRRF